MIDFIKKLIKKLFKLFFPKYYYQYFEKRTLHKTYFFKICNKLLDKNMNSIDIGSNIGSFTYFFSLKSNSVFAFEPNPFCYKIFLKRKIRNSILYKFALSKNCFKTKLFFPEKNIGCGTIEKENIKTMYMKNKNYIKKMEVDVKTLDAFNFKSVSLIKIDVEGHEFDVLKGSIKTINNNLPSFVIEIEERHKKRNIKKISKFFSKKNYFGFFILNSNLTNIEKFNLKEHQSLNNKIYINNFFFIHKKKIKINNLK